MAQGTFVPMSKAIIVSFLSLSILLFGGVGQLAASTCLVGGSHSTMEVMLGADQNGADLTSVLDGAVLGSSTINEGLERFVLEFPVLETEDEKLTCLKKRSEESHGSGTVLAALYRRTREILNGSLVTAPSGNSTIHFPAIGQLYLVYGVIRV